MEKPKSLIVPIGKNLNESLIPNDDRRTIPVSAYRRNKKLRLGATRLINIYFVDLINNLCEHINKADIVLGCVAWLTHPKVLIALRGKQAVSIVVQKEDWLRPDPGVPRDHLRELYSELPAGLSRRDRVLRDLMLGNMSWCSDETIDAIRCVGIASQNRTIPRMHHKFLVFCEAFQKRDPCGRGKSYYYIPTSVWTGSLNPTKNGGLSFENAVVIESEDIAMHYFEEWANLLTVSEPLDWQATYMEPEWKIGT